MSQRVTTAGKFLCYAVEETAGVMPTTGYKVVPEVKSMPNLNPAPNMQDSTTLLETEYMTSEEGLKDLGGPMEYGANMTDDLEDFWDDAIAAYEAAAAEGKKMWWATAHPKLKNARFIPGKPSSIGLNDSGVNAMEETTLYITPQGGIKKGPRPGIDEASKKLVPEYTSTYDGDV